MSDLKNDSPRRYTVDSVGRRVIVGLTIEETIEFERLDNPATRRLNDGHVLWNGSGAGPNKNAEERWLELYAKHEQAWSEWIAAESRGRRNSRAHPLN